MAIDKQALSVILLFFITFFGYAQVHDRELDQHQQKIQEAFSRLLPEISDELSDNTLTVEEQYALFAPMAAYANRNRSAFLDLRRKYLRNVPPPPAELKNIGLEASNAEYLTRVLGDPYIASIVFMQCVTPFEVGELISSLARPYSHLAGVDPDEQRINYAFGSQVFAENVRGDEWQIWEANRAYMVRFNLQLDDMTVSDVAFTSPNDPAYQELQLPFIPYKQHFAMDSLYQDMMEVRWDTYSVDLVRESTLEEWQDTVYQAVLAFYTQNQQRFTRIQTERLAGLEKGDALDSSWAEVTSLTTEERNLLQEVLYPYLIDPGEAANNLFFMTNAMPPFNQEPEEVVRNASIVGFRHYQLGEQRGTWEVLSVGNSVAFSYTWDVNAGRFSALKVFSSENPQNTAGTP